MITQGVDVLVIIPHNGAAMAKAVELAHEAGIPVLAYDRLITGCDLDLYMTFDNVKVGELQARFLTERFATTGGKKQHRPHLRLEDGQQRARSSSRARTTCSRPLIESGAIEVVHEDWAQDWKPENAKKDHERGDHQGRAIATSTRSSPRMTAPPAARSRRSSRKGSPGKCSSPARTRTSPPASASSPGRRR